MLANDSIIVTPGVGASVATHLIAGKEHQAYIQVDPQGHILGSLPHYTIVRTPQANVAAVSNDHLDLFNGSASDVIRVRSIRHIPGFVAPAVGVALAWTLYQTTAVGTGGTALTPWLADTSQAALDAGITCRSKPTGGATRSIVLIKYQCHYEETLESVIRAGMNGGIELVPPALIQRDGPGIVLRPGEGISCVQETSSDQGTTGWLVTFTVE